MGPASHLAAHYVDAEYGADECCIDGVALSISLICSLISFTSRRGGGVNNDLTLSMPGFSID